MRISIILFTTLVLGACDDGGALAGDGSTEHVHDPAQSADGAAPSDAAAPLGRQDGGSWPVDAGMPVMPRDDGTCDVPAHCKAPENPCELAICINHTCHQALQPAGTLVSGQTEGDCTRLECDARGQIQIVADGADVPADDLNPCTMATCEGQTPSQLPLANGTVLPQEAQTDGDCKVLSCDGLGHLAAVTAINDPPTPQDACHVPACDGRNPSSTPAEAGTSCGVGTVCDGTGKCLKCIEAQVSCQHDWQCCDGTCNDGKCDATVCKASTRWCDASSVWECSGDGLSKHKVSDCSADTYCDELGDGSALCHAYLCQANSKTCSVDVVKTCASDGKSYLPDVDCGSLRKTCSNGACVESSGPHTDVIGTTTLLSESVGPDYELNGFKMTQARTLTELEVYLKVTTTTSITFLVYEGASGATTLTRIAQKTVSVPASQGYVSSGALSVPLKFGYQYGLGIGWNGSVATTNLSSGLPLGLSFGGSLGFASDFLSATPATILLSDLGGWQTSGVVGQRIHTSGP